MSQPVAEQRAEKRLCDKSWIANATTVRFEPTQGTPLQQACRYHVEGNDFISSPLEVQVFALVKCLFLFVSVKSPSSSG